MKKGIEDKSDNKFPILDDRFWITLFIILIILIGFIFISIYVVYSATSTDTVGSMLGPALLIAGASFLVGAIIGCVFGIPRTLQRDLSPPAPPTQTANSSNQTVTDSTNIRDRNLRYQVNTNLEQISDWLTKILVGLGLTNFREIPDLFVRLTNYLPLRSIPTLQDRSVITSALVYFLVFGFISGYLVMRLVLTGAFVRADKQLEDAQETIIGLVEQTIDKLVFDVEEKKILNNLLEHVGKKTDYTLPLDFTRESKEHHALRSLRTKLLITPKEGRTWQAGRTVVFTDIGQRLIPQLQAKVKV